MKDGREIKPFGQRLWLSSPTMHGEELRYVQEAYDTNWMATVGENIDRLEEMACRHIGCGYAVALSSGTAALHMAVKLAGVRPGDRVFCTDLTFDATVNPVVYEGGIPVFIDAERDTWNMSPDALDRAFALYPDVRVVIVANLYGVPAKLDRLREVCDLHGAVLIEDAAESLGALYRGRQTGGWGDFGAVSYNGNKIITGSSGGMLLTDDREAAGRARKWSAQSREDAPWYQHEELGYNYRMSNVIAGVVRGQYAYLGEHIARKKAIYMRYQEGLAGLPVSMNPYLPGVMEPNFWLSCITVDAGAMCRQVRSGRDALYISEPGRSCPTEILEMLAQYNVEGRPVWKPMHMQPFYCKNPFVTAENGCDVGADLFERGLCLPSDTKMTREQQDAVIELIGRCFA